MVGQGCSTRWEGSCLFRSGVSRHLQVPQLVGLPSRSADSHWVTLCEALPQALGTCR